MIPALAVWPLIAIGGVATLFWMLEQRIYVSAATSSGAWGILAYAGGTIQKTTESGSTVPVDGWWIQVLAIFLAGVSLFVILATWTGHYPPQEEQL